MKEIVDKIIGNIFIWQFDMEFILIFSSAGTELIVSTQAA